VRLDSKRDTIGSSAWRTRWKLLCWKTGVTCCCYLRIEYEGVSRKFWTESITKYTRTTINTRWEATQRIMASKLTKLTHKIAIQLHLLTAVLFVVLFPGGQFVNFWIHPRTPLVPDPWDTLWIIHYFIPAVAVELKVHSVTELLWYSLFRVIPRGFIFTCLRNSYIRFLEKQTSQDSPQGNTKITLCSTIFIAV
jgi:hypothetical protein